MPRGTSIPIRRSRGAPLETSNASTDLTPRVKSASPVSTRSAPGRASRFMAKAYVSAAPALLGFEVNLLPMSDRPDSYLLILDLEDHTVVADPQFTERGKRLPQARPVPGVLGRQPGLDLSQDSLAQVCGYCREIFLENLLAVENFVSG